MSRSRRYVAMWAGLVVGFLALVGGFNAIVDPYGMFRIVHLPGFNELKPRIGPQVRLAKPYQVQMVEPNGLILGNSRAELGLSPTHPAWPAEARPVFNLAIPGGDLFMQLRHLQHATAVNRPRLVVLGLDFMDFLLVEPDSRIHLPGYEDTVRAFEERLLVGRDMAPYEGYATRMLLDRKIALFSLSAFRDSVATLALQWDEVATTRTPLGFNPGLDHLFYLRVEGQHALFEQRTRENIRSLGSAPRGIFTGGERWSPVFEELEALIRFCRDNDIELQLYIHPYHAVKLELYRMFGLWDEFEDWKRTLAGIVAADAAAHPDRPAIPLWDFALYNEVTTEPVPPPGDLVTVMQWHWESGHYNERLGDLILDVMLGGAEIDPAIARRLTPETVEQTLTQVRLQRAAFAVSQPQVVARLERTVESILGPRLPPRAMERADAE